MGPFEKQIEALSAPRVGMRVMYAKTFLRSIAASPTDFMWRARGTITRLRPVGSRTTFAEIKWDDDLQGETGFGRGKDFPSRVNVLNLTKVGTNEG